MRTLKKVLALSMVFAMAFSMMAGAAFNDQDQIDASLVEDIQLLTALEVFQGDEKGDFNPTSNVTRAQAAKMIYVLKNNGQDDEAAAFKGQSVYSDVPSGHWAEGYINYATNLGIMSGWTEGSVRKFDPNGNVTGLELTKMLLCMIGYRADIQGYTGSGWQTNVLKDGAASAITTNYLPTIYSAAPRQWTARLMANAINAPYVSYSRGELVTGSATDPSRSYGLQYLGLEMVEGYLRNAGKVGINTQTTTDANGKVTGTTRDIILNEDGDKIVVDTTRGMNGSNTEQVTNVYEFKTTVDPMMLGQHVKVYFKNINTTTREYKVYSVLPTSKSRVYDVTLADVTIDINKTGETIKFSGYNGGSAKTYAEGTSIDVIWNLAEIQRLKANDSDNKDSADGKTATKHFAPMSGNSTEAIRFVDQDGDGVIDLALSNKVNYAIVTSHNSAKNSIRFEDADGDNMKLIGEKDKEVNVSSESDYKKLNFVNDVVADDFVKVTLDGSAGKKVWNVEKVEPTTGSVSGYTLNTANTKYNSITLNGESTKIAANKLQDYDDTTGNTALLNDTTFYTDGKYIIYSKGGDSVASVGNLAYIIGKQSYEAFGKTTWYAKVLLSDGTQGEYEVAATYQLQDTNDKYGFDGKLVETDSVDGNLIKENSVMSYSISNNKITLNELRSDKNGITFDDATLGYNDKSERLTGVTSNVIADEAYFFIVSNVTTKEDGSLNYAKAKYNVVKGSELGKSLESKVEGTYAYKTVNSIPSVVFGTMTIENNAVSTAAEYAFVKSAASYSVVDDNYEAQMTVVLPNGEDQVIKKSFTNASGALTQVQQWNGFRGQVVTYDLDADGNVDNGKLTPITASEWTTNDVNSITDGSWYKVRINGWNSSNANISDANGGNELVMNVASDVKIHAVNTSDNDYATYVADGSVSKTATKNDNDEDIHQVSALIYVEKSNGAIIIKDIFAEEDGGSIDKMF